MDTINPIVIRDTDKKCEYTLEFDRDTVRFAESRGFKLEQVDEFPMTKIPEFFWYAFRMHHKSIALNQAEEILRQIGGMNEKIAKRLLELWAKTYETLGTEEEKNPNMTVEL